MACIPSMAKAVPARLSAPGCSDTEPHRGIHRVRALPRLTRCGRFQDAFDQPARQLPPMLSLERSADPQTAPVRPLFAICIT
jgi:hypothetical protein